MPSEQAEAIQHDEERRALVCHYRDCEGEPGHGRGDDEEPHPDDAEPDVLAYDPAGAPLPTYRSVQ